MTSKSSAGIARHALAGDCATISLGVGSFLAGAAPVRSAAAAITSIDRMLSPHPVCRQSSRALAAPLSPRRMYTFTLMLLGSGELGREFAIAAKRLGCR